jgi:hypothetical protein
MSGNKAALERSAQIRERLAPYQGGLGVFAIVMGVVYLVWLYVL